MSVNPRHTLRRHQLDLLSHIQRAIRIIRVESFERIEDDGQSIIDNSEQVPGDDIRTGDHRRIGTQVVQRTTKPCRTNPLDHRLDADPSACLVRRPKRPVEHNEIPGQHAPQCTRASANWNTTLWRLGAVRVARTAGMMGEIVGLAASICAREVCSPREVYTQHLDELLELIGQGVPK